jgi:predicted lipid-binding transport protein (Tim44 family)
MDPILLILAGVTAFIIFRLISVMGTRTGHEQQHDLEALERASRSRASDEAQEEKDRASAEPVAPKPVSTNARALRDADPAFDEGDFLSGARSAYEMIVEAFASGDVRSIRPYLGDSVYEAFKGAIVARENAEHTTDLKFVGIDRAAIVDSEIDEKEMRATVEFTSNQVRVTRDKNGEVVSGDPNRIDLVKDRWTFSKKRASRDPNWALVATGGAA